MKTKILLSACLLLAATSAPGALVITEVMANSGSETGATNGDWFELTNTGSVAIDLTGYYWDDGGSSANDGSLFPGIVIGAGDSIVIVDENATNLSAWVTAWGGSVVAYSSETFGGPNTFSGLSANGDQIEIWDADPNAGTANLVASAYFGTSTTGYSFIWDTEGNSLGISVAGENGAYTAANGDVGSAGTVVPEPSIALFGGLGLLGLFLRRR
ncbi:hypothetical protein HNR46_002877 [Haloferula luteola]|uniref:LTD domain-containing protein n=1 Tax=Haloferula luteola TaxID=595692 RepID=A0A840VFN3_9BACT|nr:lamin tail domain-containing protein [Haloferula luteola]MBB5352629.1 hypothetical protein [Haloferula luteola]